MGVLADEYIRLRPDVSRMPRDIRKAGADAGKQFQGSFASTIRRSVKGGLVGVGLAAGIAFGAALKKGFGRLSAIEDAKAKLTGLGHSAKTVDKIMVNALASVKGTAFGLDAAATLAATAVAAGIKPGRELERTLKLVADAATIGGTSLSEMGAIFNQVAASNKVQGDTINQLNERGIPILKLLGDVMGKNQGEVAELASKGKIDFATFQKAMEQGLGGAALKSGKTASGAFKNMGAAFARVGAALLKEVFPKIGEGIGGITKWLDDITPIAERIGKSWGKMLQSEAFKTAVADLKEAVAALTGNEDLVKSLEDMAGALPKVVQGLATAITKYTEFAAVVDKFENQSFAEGDKTGGPVGQLVKDFGAGGTIERALIQFRGFTVRHVKQGWADVKAVFAEDSSQVVAGVGRFVGRIVSWFARLPGRVMQWVRRLWSDAKASFVKNHAELLAGVKRFFDKVKSLWSSATTWLRSKWSSFWNIIKTVAQAAFNVVRSRISTVWNAVRSLWTRAQTAVRNTWSSFWTGVKTTASNAMDAVRTKITAVLNRIKTAFSTAKSNIRSIWNGVKDAVSRPITWVKDNVYNKPLVPVWNRVASLVSGPKLSTYASGGVEPGYTPGRDTHLIGVGGGEAIMRPEFTRAVGKGWIDAANRKARQGVGKAREFMGVQGFQTGGVVGWLRGLTSTATGKITDLAGKLKGWVLGGLKAAAEKILNPLKNVIGRALPNSGVGSTVGNIGKKAIDLVLNKIGSSDMAAVAAQGGYTGPPGTGSRRIVNWRGGRFTERFRNTLGQAQSMTRAFIRVIQGGFSRSVAASGTSHYGDAIDAPWNASILTALRRAGVAAWHRTPSQGFSHHIHGVPLPGRGYPGGSGIWQAQDYLRGGNGLALGGIVKGGRGGITAQIGEGRRDELVAPLPRSWRSGQAAAVARRPITIMIDMGDGLVQKIQGIIDDNDEFRATVGRTR